MLTLLGGGEGRGSDQGGWVYKWTSARAPGVRFKTFGLAMDDDLTGLG